MFKVKPSPLDCPHRYWTIRCKLFLLSIVILPFQFVFSVCYSIIYSVSLHNCFFLLFPFISPHQINSICFSLSNYLFHHLILSSVLCRFRCWIFHGVHSRSFRHGTYVQCNACVYLRKHNYECCICYTCVYFPSHSHSLFPH